MSWRERAACRGCDPEMFFPERGANTVAQTKAVCAGCEVRDECLAENLGERVGVWGGLSERERRILRRDQPRSVPPHGTRTRYVYGCRCVECRLADSTYKRGLRGRVA